MVRKRLDESYFPIDSKRALCARYAALEPIGDSVDLSNDNYRSFTVKRFLWTRVCSWPIGASRGGSNGEAMKGTINIGDRQRGRLRATSLIDCAAERRAIDTALQQLYSPEFQSRLPGVRDPYGEGGASARIIPIPRDYPLEFVLKKTFSELR